MAGNPSSRAQKSVLDEFRHIHKKASKARKPSLPGLSSKRNPIAQWYADRGIFAKDVR